MNALPFRDAQVHLMGIGGAGVGALVPLLQSVQARVSGCDLADGPDLARLRAAGVPVSLGHDPAHLAGVDLLVHSSAVPEHHPEIRAARAAGIRVLHRPACLAELMRGCRTVAIAGSHGKTSTSWMCGHLLIRAGADPVVMVGGAVPDLNLSGARPGAGKLFVAEVDESDGGFSHVQPEIAVVTNLEAEHLRHYGSFAALCDAFANWLAEIPAEGAAVLPAEGLDPRVEAGLRCRVLRCGIGTGDLRADELELGPLGSRCRLRWLDEDLGQLVVPVPGEHMVRNALMALAAARLVSPQVSPAALADCGGVRRRFTVHGEAGGVRVVEDYGHHPTEIRATIAAAALAGGQVHVLFQPHRYSRSADLFADFAAAFDGAAALALLPVYAAGEEAIPGVGGLDLTEAIIARRRGAGRNDAVQVQYAPQDGPALAFLAAQARPGDTVLVLGAGDVGALAEPLLEQWR